MDSSDYFWIVAITFGIVWLFLGFLGFLYVFALVVVVFVIFVAFHGFVSVFTDFCRVSWICVVSRGFWPLFGDCVLFFSRIIAVFFFVTFVGAVAGFCFLSTISAPQGPFAYLSHRALRDILLL